MKFKPEYILFVILSLLNYPFGQAQNMVPNPGFEDLKAPPSCWTFDTREKFSAHVEEWIIPNMGTADLLSTDLPDYCITAMPMSTALPVDYFPRGSQMPRSGKHFAGIKPLNDNRREYLEVKLVCPLVPGEEYYAEMYVSLSENTNYAQNKLAMYFSDTLIYTQSFEMLDFVPQIVEEEVIADTVNWVKIAGTFIAATPAQYLVIGSFAARANTMVQYLGDKGEIDFPYYFIDDVTVRRVNPPEVTITGDTVVCKGDTVRLNAGGWSSVSWLTPSARAVILNTNDLIFVPSSNTIITAQTNHCNLQLSRKVTIVVVPDPLINIGKDTMICQGTSLTLDAGPGLHNYNWSNGSSSQAVTISQPGTYRVTAVNSEGCIGEDEIMIGNYKTPYADLGSDQLTCRPEGILDAFTGEPYHTYEWQDNSTSPQFQYSSEGMYWVKVTNICGEEYSDSVAIKKIIPFIPNLVTPNGDGKNERFEILNVESGRGALWVYNRYGEAVLYNESYANEFSGEELSEGIYYYQFVYPTCPGIKGWVHILK